MKKLKCSHCNFESEKLWDYLIFGVFPEREGPYNIYLCKKCLKPFIKKIISKDKRKKYKSDQRIPLLVKLLFENISKEEIAKEFNIKVTTLKDNISHFKFLLKDELWKNSPMRYLFKDDFQLSTYGDRF